MVRFFSSLLALLITSTAFAATPHYVITNDDNGGPNTVSLYTVTGSASSPRVTLKKTLSTGGMAIGGGYFAGTDIILVRDGQDDCAFVANGGTSDITGIKLSTQQVTGNFKGSRNDNGGFNGVTLTTNGSYVYASFTGTFTIASLQIIPGCALQFVKDISAVGKDLGMAGPIAAKGNILIVSYGDGSIESFDISNGYAKPNNDEQFASGVNLGDKPSGIDITQDGHYAIFGDIAGGTTVEVSDISGGKLTPTLVYNLGSAIDSNNVRLSPDESLLYISNNMQGTVTAAFFDKTTGAATPGCTSNVLKGYPLKWFYDAGLGTALATGTGGLIYVAEDGPSSGIGLLNITVNGSTCTLTELPSSPVADPNSPDLRSFQAYPNRPF